MNETKSSYLTGFVIGGLIGSAVALVLAPQTGSSARSRFSNSVATLNRRITHDSSETVVEGQESSASSETQTVTATTDEPRKTIPTEGNSASPPSSEKS